jgi:putative DNA primase/helicase
MTAAEVARALGGAKCHGAEWDARCPAHNDANPSLSLRDGDDGKILFRCHAGCSQQQVFDALRARGLLERRSNGQDHHPRAKPETALDNGKDDDWRSIFPPPVEAHEPAELLNTLGHDTLYPYYNQDGRIGAYVARYEARNGKRKWFQPVSYGVLGGVASWYRKAITNNRPLYHLDQLAARPDAMVLVCEGEKSADAAAEPFPACVCTTWQGGTGAVAKTDWSPLANRPAIIWPDNDATGRKAAAAIHRMLPHASVLRVDDLPPGGDAYDLRTDDPDRWLDAHLTEPARGEEADDLEAEARGPEPPPDEETDVVDRPPGFSDEDLALKFTRKHRNLLRYVARWGQWFIWKSTLWVEDETLQAFDLSRAICRKASSACSHPKIRAVVASAKTVAAVERLTKADRAHAATTAQWDSDPWLLNTPGGVVDLRTGHLQPHRQTDYMTKITAAAPANDAACPLWHRFLHRVTGGDVDLQAFLQRITGYGLTGITEDHALFFLYGTGRNGKGVFINTLTRLLGLYATVAGMETFTAAPHDRHPADLAALRGARLVAAQETEEGRNWAETRIKALTGGDPISARFMRQDFFTYTPQFKLFIAGNHKPGLRNVDEAIRSRLNLIPFTVFIPAQERDPKLEKKLEAEWPGILQWAIEGCLAWQRIGLAPPKAVTDATEEYMQTEDTIATWIAACCETSRYNAEASSTLYASYKAWAVAANEDLMSHKRFSQALAARGYNAWKMHGQMKVEGIQLAVPRSFHETDYDR